MTIADPSGLLARIPELEQLIADDALRRVVEEGKPHAVYRRLWWLRRKTAFSDRHGLIDLLLKRRRLFLTPIQRAPMLSTINGVGALVYGNSEPDPSDGTYIKSHFLVFVFVPVYPFSQYLVSDGDGGKGWRFIGKVPLSLPMLLWQRLLAFGAILAVLFGAVSAVEASLYQDVRVVNAFAQPIVANVGAVSMNVPARSSAVAKVGTGKAVITITTTAGQLVERGELDVRSGHDVFAWNVLGAAPIFHETIWYSAPGAPPRDGTVRPLCDQQAITFDDVDYAFVEPPKTMRLEQKDQYRSRSHVGFENLDAEVCLAWLLEQNQIDKAARLATRLTHAFPNDGSLLELATNAMVAAGRPGEALRLAQQAAALPEASVNAHRAYQDQMLAAGRRAEVVEHYRKRAAGSEASADARYLAVRLVSAAEALPITDEILKLDPDHALTLRLRAYSLIDMGRWSDADAAFDQLRVRDPNAWEEALQAVVSARVGNGRSDDALAILQAHFKPTAADGIQTAVHYARVAAHSGAADPDALIRQVGDASDAGKALRTWSRVRAGLLVTDDELQALPPDLQALARTTLSVGKSAADALQSLADLPVAELRRLDTELWALLFAEAVRVDRSTAQLAPLIEACPLGGRAAEQLAAFVRHGDPEASLEVESLPPESQASLYFVRSRVTGLPAVERQQLLARAEQLGLTVGVAARARTSWQP